MMEELSDGPKGPNKKIYFIILSLLLLPVFVYLAAQLPEADFYLSFYPASRGIFTGHSPYEQTGYICAPWGVIPLIPFVVFPPMIARGLFFVACTLLFILVSWRLKAPPLATIFFLLSPTAIGALLVGNIDPMVMSGILLPPIWGLIVLLIKPQIGFGVAVYFFAESFRKGKISAVIRTFAPVVIAYLLALIFFPIWFERMINNPSNIWNRTLFPYSIPLGLFFIWIAIRKRNPYYALAATPFLAPYHSFYTYSIVQIGLLNDDVENYIRRDVLQIILCIFLWTVMLVFKL